MSFNRLVLTIAIGSVYLGFSVTLGLLLHDRKSGARPSQVLPLLAFVLFVYLPATAMVLSFSHWSLAGRLAAAGLGWLAGVLSAAQPAWIPALVWQRGFQRAYLALAMASVTVWGLSTWAVFSSGAAMLIGLAALTAGSSSARSMLAA